MRIIKGIALYISFAVLVFAVFYCLSVALMYAYGLLVKPLPIEPERVVRVCNDGCLEAVDVVSSPIEVKQADSRFLQPLDTSEAGGYLQANEVDVRL